MKVKSSIKKIGAVAGSLTMVGMTLGAAASLADFPQPFVEDNGVVNSQIVVGSNGKVADVVGAVNLAATLGQNAIPTTANTVPGQTSADVDGKQYDVAIRATGLTDGWIDASSYSKLRRNTVTDSDGNDHRVLEQIGVDPDSAGEEIGHAVNGSATLATVDPGAVQYQVSYTPGFTVGDSIAVIGNEYEVTAITQDSDGTAQLQLGSKQAEQGLELDDSYEHGPYTIKVVDKDESAPAIYLQISKDGHALTSFGLNTGESRTVDDGALEITADEVFFGSRSDYIDVTSVYTDTTVTQGEDSPFDNDYTVRSLAGNFSDNTPDAGTVEGLTLESNVYTTTEDPAETEDENDIPRLAAGEVFDGPAGYFDVVFQGLTAADQEQISFGSGTDVSFTDPNYLAQSVAMQDVLSGQGLIGGESGTTGAGDGDGNRYAVDVSEVSTGSTGAVTVTHRSWQETISYDGTDFTDNTVVAAVDKLGTAADVASSDLPVSFAGQTQPTLYNPSDNQISNSSTGSMTLSGFSAVTDVDYTAADVSTQFDITPGGDDTTVTLTVGTSSTSQTVTGGSTSTTVSLSLAGQDIETNNIVIEVADDTTQGDTVGQVTIDTNVQTDVSGVNTSAASGGQTESLSFSTDGTELTDYGTAAAPSFELAMDQRYARVFATGYGFDIGAEFVNTVDGSAQGIDRINLGSGTTEDTVLYSDSTTFSVPTAARLSTGFGAELTFNDAYENSDGATVDAVTVNEDTGMSDVGTTERVHVAYEDATGDDYTVDTGEIGEIEFASGLATVPAELTDDGDATVTNVGSTAARSGPAQASVQYPDGQRNAQFVLGAVAEIGDTGQYEAIAADALGRLPDMARLDTEATDSVRSNNHLVLVGGPAVNSLVSTLVDRDAVDLSEVADARSGAVLQVVNDAFASGQHALVVAGYAAQDTRDAAKYLANYADHQDTFEGKERLVLTEADYPSSQ